MPINIDDLPQAERDRIYAEWQAQGSKIQQQKRKEALADPVIDLAEKVRRWARK